MTLELQVNGDTYELELPVGHTLAETLRDDIGLTGTKIACGEGHCGACTVLLDGVPVTGCITLAGQVAGREVTTAEALGGSDPVQRAFATAQAFQCGWCTPGFVLAARALLEENPDPSDAEIAEALGGNLCRCGSYVKIADAVRIAAREPAA